jgi:CRP-like cAMP-binding protein
MATAVALTDCVLITILSFSINDLTNKHPELLEKIKLIINDRILLNKEKLN